VRSALQELQKLMPLLLRNLDVNNDTAFMNEVLERWCAALWDTAAWRDLSSWSGFASSMRLCGYSPTSTSRRPSGFRLRRATVEGGAARVDTTTNRLPQQIGYCVGMASSDKTAKALRRCSSNAIQLTNWR
jgi:hypothetical protein